MNVPPPSSSFMPPPLEEAIPESFYQKYVNPHPKLPEESEPHSGIYVAIYLISDVRHCAIDVATRLSEEALTVAADVLEGVTAGEVKNVIEKIAATTITSFQVSLHIFNKLVLFLYCLGRTKSFRNYKIKRNP